MMFWFDQIVSWIAVLLGWWIIHQTSHAKFHIGGTLMRIGVACTMGTIAFVALDGDNHIPFEQSELIFKICAACLFLGVAIFHHKRFGSL